MVTKKIDEILPSILVRLSPIPAVVHMNGRDIYEQVTVPDVSPSLHSMVTTGVVSQMGNSRLYTYPDLEQDDEAAHERPDYQKLDQLDMVEKENYVTQWLEKPENYEKVEQTPGTEPEAPEQKAKPEQSEG